MSSRIIWNVSETQIETWKIAATEYIGPFNFPNASTSLARLAEDVFNKDEYRRMEVLIKECSVGAPIATPEDEFKQRLLTPSTGKAAISMPAMNIQLMHAYILVHPMAADGVVQNPRRKDMHRTCVPFVHKYKERGLDTEAAERRIASDANSIATKFLKINVLPTTVNFVLQSLSEGSEFREEFLSAIESKDESTVAAFFYDNMSKSQMLHAFQSFDKSINFTWILHRNKPTAEQDLGSEFFTGDSRTEAELLQIKLGCAEYLRLLLSMLMADMFVHIIQNDMNMSHWPQVDINFKYCQASTYFDDLKHIPLGKWPLADGASLKYKKVKRPHITNTKIVASKKRKFVREE